MFKKTITTLLFSCFSVMAFASSGSGGGSLLSGEMLFKVINFIILLFLLNKFARKPISNMLSSSAAKSKEEVDAAKADLENAKEKIVEYQRKIATLEKELEQRQQSALSAIEAEKKQIAEEARHQVEKLEEQAESRIEQSAQKAKDEIRAFIADESIKLAEKIIADQVGSKEQKALVNNYTKFLKETA